MVGEQRVRRFGDNRDLVVAQYLNFIDIAGTITDHSELLNVKLRRVLIRNPVEVPDDIFGNEIAPIVPLNALSEGDQPALVIVRVNFPGRGQARLDVGRRVALRQVPKDQWII